MSDPNACPESLELQLLRELRDEMRAERAETRERLGRIETGLELVRLAVVGLGTRTSAIEKATLTPVPLRAVSDSWLPDHGDNGR